MEMATGQPLFPGDSDTEQLWLILQVPPPLPFAACCCLQPCTMASAQQMWIIFCKCTGIHT